MRARPLFLLLFSAGPALAALAEGCSSGGHDRAKPHSPTHVLAYSTGGDSSITVQWDDVANADAYVVYQARQQGVTQSNYNNLTDGSRIFGATSPYTLDATTANYGDTWFFVVTSVTAQGYESADSQQVFASPSPWDKPVAVEPGGLDAIDPSIGQDAAGNIVAVWSKQEAARYAIHSATMDFATGTWNTPAVIDTAGSFSYTPRVAVRGDGLAAAIWREGDSARDDIWSNERSSAGVWGIPTLVEHDDTGSARNPVIAANATHTLAAWTQHIGASDEVLVNDYAPPGLGWASANGTLVSTTSGNGDLAKLGIDAAGNGDILYVQGTLWSSRVVGNAPQTPVAVSLTSGIFATALAMNDAGDAIGTWLQPGAAGFDVWAATYAAGVWSAPEVIETAPGLPAAPAVAIDAAGDGVIIFPQVSGLHAQLQAVIVTGGVFQPPERIDNDGSGDVKEVAVAARPAGGFLAVWSQNIVGNGGPNPTKNIYSNRYHSGTASWESPVLVSDFGLSENPQLVVGPDGTATALWTFLQGAGREIRANRLP